MKLSEKITAITAKNKNVLLVSFAISTFLVGITLIWMLLINAQYFSSADDCILKKVVEGASSSANAPFSPRPYMVFCNYIYGLILSFFYLILPCVPWYTIFLLLISVFAYTLLLYKILLLCRQSATKSFIGLTVFIMLYLIANFVLQIGFTGTAVLCCGVGVFYYLTSSHNADKKEKIFDTVNLCLLALLTIFLREETIYVFVAFCALIFIFKLVANIKDYKKATLAVLPVLACLLFAFSVQLVVKNLPNNKSYSEYNYDRSMVFDYYGFPDWAENSEFYEEIGIDYESYEILATNTFIFDDILNAEQLSEIADFQMAKNANQGIFVRVGDAFKGMIDNLSNYSFTRSAYIIVFFMIALLVVNIALKNKLRVWLILGFIITSILLYFYLNFIQRAPGRAVRPIYFIVLLACTYLVLSQDFEFLKAIKPKYLYYGITAALLIVCVPGIYINLREDRAASLGYAENIAVSTELRNYVLDNSENNYIVGFNDFYTAENLFFNNNSLARMNFISRSVWDINYPEVKSVYAEWGIDSVTVANICDKNTYLVFSQGGKEYFAFDAYIAKHHMDMAIAEIDIINTDYGNLSVYQIISE